MSTSTRAYFGYIGVALFVGLAVAGSHSLGLFSGLEFFLEDLLFSRKPISPEIVIVAIDNDSLERIGQWPWPREVFANFLLAGEEAKPRVVGFDVMLSEPSRLGERDDAALIAALNSISYPVVFPIEAVLVQDEKGSFRAETALATLPRFTQSKNAFLGHVNLLLDRDGAARKFLPEIVIKDKNREQRVRSFAYELYPHTYFPQKFQEPFSGADVSTADEENFLREVSPNKAQQEVGVGVYESGRSFASKKAYAPRIDGEPSRIVYAGPPGTIRRISFWRLVEKGPDTARLLDSLKEKVILLGATAPDLHDERFTPVSAGIPMPGVEIQAHMLNMRIMGYRLLPLDSLFTFIWIFLSSLASALLFMAFKTTVRPVAISFILGVMQIGWVVVLFRMGIAAHIVHIVFAWGGSMVSLVAYRYFYGEQERKELTRVFSKYVSGEVLKEILRDPRKVSLGGEERMVTVFFSDIRGFTTISEKTTPKELVRILNGYFTHMGEEVVKNYGILDKYIGDAIMAFWGAPIDDPDQADHALRASLGMLAKLKQYNEELQKTGDPEINIGIGLYTGPAVAGNVGSKDRFDYTVIGDTVNVAARLESLNKEYKTHLILGESTKNMIKADVRWKPLGSVTVKGRKEALAIYTVEEGEEI
ncbi:MAG: adenylate/guanylate cyclase with Chase sensor [Parcubacteria group bacterium Gr01-1014_33]|nr:MAG: adenylate/guanylate cyclase with Chase sensor [Parcubacteria group bacterium Gr01-1014_33]